MAGRIQYVDAEAVKVELHRRGGHRNAALLFDLHPVRGGVAGGLARLDRTGLADGPAVEQQFFRQRGLARVRVGDDGERAPARHFRRKLRVQHVPSSKSSQKITSYILTMPGNICQSHVAAICVNSSEAKKFFLRGVDVSRPRGYDKRVGISCIHSDPGRWQGVDDGARCVSSEGVPRSRSVRPAAD